MDTVLNEKGNVNTENEITSDDYLDNVIKGLEDGLTDNENYRKTGVFKPATTSSESLKQEAGNVKEKKEKAGEVAPTNSPVSSKQDADGEGKKEKKEKPPTLDYLYVNRKDFAKKKYISFYRRDGQFVFKWTGEYWQEQDETTIKAEITNWMEKNYPTEFFSRNLNSIYTMFVNSIAEFGNKKITGIIIPTKRYWLSVDEKTGDITAIEPSMSQPVKYQIDLVVPAAGPFIIPQKPVTSNDETSMFHNFINSSLTNTDTRKVVQEFCGLSLTNSMRKEKMQWWIGKGANGKSVLIKILSSFHGNPVSVNISDIGQYNSHLIGASLVFATETNKKGFDQEFLKQAVSGDTVEVRAIYGKKQNTNLTAKWILLMNDIPMISDFSDAIFRRTQLIHWDKQFLENDPAKIEDLAIKIIKEEKQDVLMWCLDGLQRMIKDGWKFTGSQAMENATFDWKNSADKVRLFAHEKAYEYDASEKITTEKDKIFKFFNEWANANNFESMSSTGFWMRMNNIFPQLKSNPDLKKNGKRVVYLNIKPTKLL